MEILSRTIADFGPDIVGVGVRSYLDDYFGDISMAVRRVAPEALFVCGGYGPTLNSELYLTWGDVVVAGDGEHAIVALADGVRDGNLDFSVVPGAVWKENGRIRRVPPEQFKDLDELPFPIYHTRDICMIDKDVLYDPADWAVWDYTTLLARGCIGECSYCSAGQIYDILRQQGCKTVKRRYRSVGRVIDELKTQLNGRDIRVNFQDSYLTGPRDYLMEFFERYRREVAKPFLAQLYPPQVLQYPEILQAALGAGLFSTVVGVQSGSEFVRRNLYNRRISNEQTMAFAQMCHEYDIVKQYHVIAGCPIETEEQFKESASYVATLPFRKDCDQLLVFQFYTFPKTPIRQMIIEAGLEGLGKRYRNMNADPMVFMRQAMFYQIGVYGGPTALEKTFAHPSQGDLRWLEKYSRTTVRHGQCSCGDTERAVTTMCEIHQ